MMSTTGRHERLHGIRFTMYDPCMPRMPGRRSWHLCHQSLILHHPTVFLAVIAAVAVDLYIACRTKILALAPENERLSDPS